VKLDEFAKFARGNIVNCRRIVKNAKRQPRQALKRHLIGG